MAGPNGQPPDEVSFGDKDALMDALQSAGFTVHDESQETSQDESDSDGGEL